MGLMNEVGSLLKQYQEGAAQPADDSVENDFQQVTQQVPRASVSTALSDAFRSDQTPPFGQIVSQLFGQSNGEQKAGILNHSSSGSRARGSVRTAAGWPFLNIARQIFDHPRPGASGVS